MIFNYYFFRECRLSRPLYTLPFLLFLQVFPLVFKKSKFGVLAMLIANGIMLLAIPISRELVK